MHFDNLVTWFDLHIKGVIHVGAHHGQEYPIYVNHGIRDMLFFEPIKSNFEILQQVLPKNHPHVRAYNIALGDTVGDAEMYVETVNQGMSCSLLKPGTHLQYYPKIVFDQTETVHVDLLDNVEFDRRKFNMLNMDVQGYEYKVLLGAKETLPFIDIIYTEINKEDVYCNSGHVECLDEYLKDFGFERVITKMIHPSWGDALYIKRKSNHE